MAYHYNLQGILGKGATLAPIIIASDKTQMTVLSGGKKAWPVYLSIGNISKEMRRRPSQHAMILIGYIPITDATCVTGELPRREKGWEIFHACMEKILEPLKKASLEGVEMVCADGGVRRVHPILASYIADFPEQCLVSCVRQNRCPICLVPSDQRGNYNLEFERRTRTQTIDALEDKRAGYAGTIEALGIRPTWPFWASLPHVDISTCMTPDLLHQMNKGVFKYHLVKWLTGILGEAEVDRRFQGMPRHQGVRHFANGLSVVSQWTGNEAKQVAKVFLPAVAGCAERDAVKAARSILDFMHRAHMGKLSDTDLEELERDLADFHDAKDVFGRTGVLDTDEMFDGIPKLHMISHYAHSICELGTTDGYNTEASERLHIDFVKEGWRASNKVNPLEQMARYIQRKESWAIMKAYLREIGQLPATCESSDDSIIEAEDNGQDDGECEVVAGTGGGDRDGNGNGNGGRNGGGNGGNGDNNGERGNAIGPGVVQTWHPAPTINIAKRPPLGKKPGTYLIEKHGATDLIPATIRFLDSNSRFPLEPHHKFKVWTRCRLSHGVLPFHRPLGPYTEGVRAFPGSWDEEGRMIRFGSFDVVLFSSELRSGEQGLQRELTDLLVNFIKLTITTRLSSRTSTSDF